MSPVRGKKKVDRTNSIILRRETLSRSYVGGRGEEKSPETPSRGKSWRKDLSVMGGKVSFKGGKAGTYPFFATEKGGGEGFCWEGDEGMGGGIF